MLFIEIGNLVLLMYYEDEWSCIIFYVSLAMIAGFESKMMSIVRTSNTAYGAKPLTYLANSSNRAVVMIGRYYGKWRAGTIDSDIFQVSLVVVGCILDSVLGLFYHTLYYYLLCFMPIFVIFYSWLIDMYHNHL